MDLQGFGISKWNATNIILLKKFFGLMMNNYPEMLGKVMITNAPFIFTSIWAIIKGWLDERVKNKISLYSSNFQNTLFEYCDRD